MRDPRIDPRTGDKVMADINGRSVQRNVLGVRLAEPGANGISYRARDITYETNLRRGEKQCWITTWQDWCHKNGAEVLETTDQQ